MGEAKHRKATDPNYGKVPKERPKRGIVVSPPMKIEGTSVQIQQTGLDTQELRFWLLFWDKLIWPSSNAIYIHGGPDEEFLIKEKILERPNYTFYGDGAQGLLSTQVAAYAEREKKEPSLWTIAQGEKSLQVVASDQIGRGLLVNLYEALPIPRGDVPLAEVLEFKRRRLPELYQLQAALDALYLKVIDSSDKEMAFRRAIEQIDLACSDLLKANKEWKWPKVIANASLGISVPVPISAAAAYFSGAPIELVAAALVGSIPQISINSGPFGFNEASQHSPYRYSINAVKELSF